MVDLLTILLKIAPEVFDIIKEVGVKPDSRDANELILLTLVLISKNNEKLLQELVNISKKNSEDLAVLLRRTEK